MNWWPHTLSPLEAWWIAQSLAGAGLTVVNWRFWYRKLVYMARHQINDPVLELIVRSHLERKVFYFLSHMGFLALGMTLAVIAPREPHNDAMRLAPFILGGVLILVMLGMQGDMIRSLRRYRYVEEYDHPHDRSAADA